MNFFLDENFPKSAESYLQSLGHKTFSTRSTNLEGIDDYSIFELAQEKEAIFLPSIPIQYSFRDNSNSFKIARPQKHFRKTYRTWFVETVGMTA